jgi:hypothetical protein
MREVDVPNYAIKEQPSKIKERNFDIFANELNQTINRLEEDVNKIFEAFAPVIEQCPDEKEKENDKCCSRSDFERAIRNAIDRINKCSGSIRNACNSTTV